MMHDREGRGIPVQAVSGALPIDQSLGGGRLILGI
jgi:hypothetical protein